MIDTSVSYMGIKLKNPLIVSSCGLTESLKNIQKAEKFGAAAVVMKSLFEEDIAFEVKKDVDTALISQHPEALDYINQMGMLLKPDTYLDHLTEIKKNVSIPVFASLNCFSSEWWLDYAVMIENTGADGLELNIGVIPERIDQPSSEIENNIIRIISATRNKIKLPMAVKIGSQFSSLPNLVNEIRKAGADAVVLFNRFYRPDIDIEKIKFKSAAPFSTSQELPFILRWIGILSDRVECDYAASTGIHTAEDLIKVILAGGTVGQVCSVIYQDGFEAVEKILNGLNSWMEEKNFTSIEDFRSLLSIEDDIDKTFYQRIQYMKHLRGTY